ncbi:patatin-like phospholipase family protein [Phenylobacterium sp.]|jgi:hypothetical protein|uniref:patatin-like phospholipase family protein n=1 Tax=Phenylobacterium sp. TaxID=1871053 RepID=UPI0025D64C75|nr:patatin-like phospholipase family protein [Phenylobacterium sp.]
MPEFERARLSVDEAEDSLVATAARLAIPVLDRPKADFEILAISGGAAGGAFGAGVLVGLTRAGKRPKFAIVTGVSTGALMAPFAFLGSDWDERLTDAYVGGHAARLWSLTRFAPTLDGGLFRPDALDSLINPFVDADLVAAVAREHALGRRLLVATTDLDSEKACIWDMGEIASRGGEPALALFRKVLAASASLPGLFPPRRIECEAEGLTYEEMHVDGGVAAPLFVMPEALLRWKDLGLRLQHSRIYVIANISLEQIPRTTEPNIVAILSRSFDTMLRSSYRQALSVVTTFCADHDLPLSVASIPAVPDSGSMLSFDTTVMRRIFDDAVARAQEPDFWHTPRSPRSPGPSDSLRPPPTATE